VMGVWFGEAIRDVIYGNLQIAQVPEALLNRPPVDPNLHPLWLLYSGLFVLLKQKLRISRHDLGQVALVAGNAFASLVFENVRSFV
jgi:hypothetical protein